MGQIDSEIRAEEFRRTKLLDALSKQSDAMRLKEKNDQRIRELEHEYQRRQVQSLKELIVCRILRINHCSKIENFVKNRIFDQKEKF